MKYFFKNINISYYNIGFHIDIVINNGYLWIWNAHTKESNHRTQRHLYRKRSIILNTTELIKNKMEFYELLLFRWTMYNFEIKWIKQKINAL